MDRSGKKVLMLAVSCAAIVVGIYMTFLKDDFSEQQERAAEYTVNNESEQGEGEGNGMNGVNAYDYSGRELPAEENETAGEAYNGDKEDIEVYFVNTDQLDKGAMPGEAQAVLSSGVQTYLRHRGYDDVTELYVDGESYKENSEKISFHCYMDGYVEVLVIEYYFEEQTLNYSIMELDEKGGTDGSQ